jgi:hypothetical protein
MTHGALSLTAPAIRSENALERFAAGFRFFLERYSASAQIRNASFDQRFLHPHFIKNGAVARVNFH